jgi:hypothetical protein
LRHRGQSKSAQTDNNRETTTNHSLRFPPFSD